jgi:hypothetical protein
MKFVGPARRQENAGTEARPGMPGFGDAFRFWLKLGFISFGGIGCSPTKDKRTRCFTRSVGAFRPSVL